MTQQPTGKTPFFAQFCTYVCVCWWVCICAYICVYCHSGLTGAVTSSDRPVQRRALLCDFFAFFPHSLVEWNMKITAFLQKAPLLQQLCYSGNSGNSTVPALCTSVVLRLKNLCAVFQCCWLLHVFAARLRWVADIYFVVVCCCCCYFFFIVAVRFVCQNVPFLGRLFAFIYSYIDWMLYICVRSLNLVNSPLTRFLCVVTLTFTYSLVQIHAFPSKICEHTYIPTYQKLRSCLIVDFTALCGF